MEKLYIASNDYGTRHSATQLSAFVHVRCPLATLSCLLGAVVRQRPALLNLGVRPVFRYPSQHLGPARTAPLADCIVRKPCPSKTIQNALVVDPSLSELPERGSVGRMKTSVRRYGAMGEGRRARTAGGELSIPRTAPPTASMGCAGLVVLSCCRRWTDGCPCGVWRVRSV